jgi:hypothetical protein
MKSWEMITVAGLVASALTFSTVQVGADTYSPGIDRREDRQQNRIYQGVDSGQITPKEFRRLENEQARIRAAETRMKADGRYTRWERYRTQQMLDRSSRHIYWAKHNQRGGAPWGYRTGRR